MNYMALIGHVVDDRGRPDRAAARRLADPMEETLEQLRERIEDPAPETHLALNPIGEIQGLLSRFAPAVNAVSGLSDAVHPARIVFGIGYGSLLEDDPIDDMIPGLAPVGESCFHRARLALKEAHDSRHWVGFRGLPGPHDFVVVTLFRLMDAIRSGWTEKQARCVRAARGRMQKDVATRLDVDPSVVSRRLKAAHFEALRAAEGSAGLLLEEMRERTAAGDDLAESTTEVS